jgi:HAE1 family hydrophobic/amphiphilic exporter-1
VDDGRFSVSIETPAGSSLDYTAAKLRQVDAVLKRLPEVARTYATVNSGTRRAGTTEARSR